MVVSVVASAGFAGAFAACIASAPDIQRKSDDDGFADLDAGIVDAAPPEPPVLEAHAITGAQPSHGPFGGGQRVLVRGNGFDSNVRVWFGDLESPEVIPVNATKVQAIAPASRRGPVDVVVQNGDDTSTRRVLAKGYTYDAIVSVPTSGPISGGNQIRILGDATQFDQGTLAFVGDNTCTTITPISSTELICTVPKGTPGAKNLRVAAANESIEVRDGYTYEDSSDGFKGGLSGLPLAGQMRVLVYNNFTGDPIEGAAVILGDQTANRIHTDASGVAMWSDAALTGPHTVTVGAYCHSPITFVDVPVDTVTVYLDPVLSPACGKDGDPPGTGTKNSFTGRVEGEIVWPSVVEFMRGPWGGPEPIGNEKAVAYFFAANNNPSAPFVLPSATAAVTPLTKGDVGFGFSFSTAPGNRSFYVLAGLEDRSQNPPKFTAYTMGIVKGVPVVPEERTEDVFVQMSTPLDLALTLAPTPPALGQKGPDRLSAHVAVRLGNDGFAILPASNLSPLLPFQGVLNFVGLPWLGADLAGASYFISARAGTGPSLVAPLSAAASTQTTTTAFTVPVQQFVGLPKVAKPASNSTWDGQALETSFSAGAAPVDMTVYDISSQSGLVRWTVAVPKSSGEVRLPDLRQVEIMGRSVGLPKGALVVGVYGAHIANFDYAKLKYGMLRPQGMTAYSLDYVNAHID